MTPLSPDTVRQWIADNLQCHHLQVAGDGQHFEALIVADAFAGLSRIRRHQLVYAALGDHMRADIHALSIRALTPAQWQATNPDNADSGG